MANRPPKQTPRKSTKPAAAAAANPAAAAKTSSSTSSPNPKNENTTAAAANPKTSSTSSPNPKNKTAAAAALQPPSSSSSSSPPSSTITEWGECSWAVKATPVEAIIPSNLPYLFCKMHDEMGDVVPKDDIYAQPPCQLLQNRRCNLVQDNTHLIYSQRHLNQNGTVQRTIRNSSATWMGRGGKRNVYGKNGDLAGTMTPLVLSFKNGKGAISLWKADEYVSCNKKDSPSAMVVLKCSSSLWKSLEMKVTEAEVKLFDSYQMLLVAKEKCVKSKLDHWKHAVSFYDGQLATAVAMLVRERAHLRDQEDRACEFVISQVGSVPSGGGGGGVRIEEPAIPLRTSVVVEEENAAPVVVDDDDDDENDENASGGMNYFDMFVDRREALRAREKGKAKVV